MNDNSTRISRIGIRRKENVSWWDFFSSSTLFMKGFLYQITGICWLHCIINLTILSPSSNDVKNHSSIKNTRTMMFLEISNASRFIILQHLIFSLLKNVLLNNILTETK